MSTEAVAAIANEMSAPPPPTATPGAEAPAASPANPGDKVSSKIELLIRREQAAVQRERAAKQKETELEAKIQAFQARESKVSEFESSKGNSKKALEMLGLNYDELTKSLLADGTIPPEVEIKKLRDEFGTYKHGQEEAERQRAEALKAQAMQQETQAVTNFKSEITTYINDNSARYELIAFDNRQEEVYGLIDAHYERTRDPETGVGKVMKIAEAADKIEEYYEKREVEKKKLTKLQSLWGAVPKTTLSEAVKLGKGTSQKPETLTNNMSAPSKVISRPSEDQRVAEIVAKFMATKRT